MKALVTIMRRSIPFCAIATLACSSLAADTIVANDRARPPVVASASPALWSVSDEDTIIYLFGTVHMMKPGTVWFDDEVKAAFDRSDVLVLEVADSDPTVIATAVARLGANRSGTPTSQMLKPGAREKYIAALKELHIPQAAMDRLDPWLVSINLSLAPLERLGYSEDDGVEKTLTHAAQTQGKPVKGLETSEEQLGFFDGLPQSAQIAYLENTVKELPKVEKEFRKLTLYWTRGESEKLGKQLNESVKETPELAKVLLFDRNARWAEWVKKRMGQPGTVFMAVGAGHLAGRGSVIDLLEQDHRKVQRLHARDFAQASAQ